MVTWEWSYKALFLCEYYLLTGDKEVLPAVTEYTVALSKGQSLYGTFGHGLALPSSEGKLHGSIAPYGPVNMAGLPANLAIVMGKKCGVKNPEVDPAVERAMGFFGYFVDKGAIPYGEHEPWPYHENNGKNSLCAVMFALQPGQVKAAQFFAKMATAGYRSRECGHTGQGFSYLWSALGANAGGPAAAAAFFKEASWHLDLVRRCDGSFTYDGGEQYGPGGTEDDTYYGKSSYYGLSPNATYVLTYALPLKKILITGKNANEANWLNKKEVAGAITSGRFDLDRLQMSPRELVAAFGDWSPIVRSWAAEELARRPEATAMVPQLIALAESKDVHAIQGACETLGNLKSVEALPVLVRQLPHPDRWARYKAAQAVRTTGAAAKPVLPDILNALAQTAEPLQPINWADPIQIAHGQLAAAVFQGPLTDALKEADPKLFFRRYVRSLTTRTAARATLRDLFENRLTVEDVQALAPEIFAAVKTPCPADTMFGNEIRMGGFKALTKYHFKEGIEAAVIFAKTQGGHGSEGRTGEIMKALVTYGSAARDDPGTEGADCGLQRAGQAERVSRRRTQQPARQRRGRSHQGHRSRERPSRTAEHQAVICFPIFQLKNLLALTVLLPLTVTLPVNRVRAADTPKPQKALPLPGEVFEVDGRTAFVILPALENNRANRPTPWVWYAPTLPGLPAVEEKWMFEQFLAEGIAVAGVDVGESYGSPQGRAHFTALYRELVERRGFSRKPCLLARSRGGLMLYNWAAEHPESVGCIAGIYPVCNIRSWPGLDKACGAYGLSAAQLEDKLTQHNPIDRLAPLAKAGVPIFHIHGDTDDVVPLKDNSAILASRYRELGGSMRLRIPPGQGHNMWNGFFQCRELVEFVIAYASPAAEREPSPALFQDPPMAARPGAFWDWMNGHVDLDRMTYELEEMKAKGMSGVEMWDIGVIRPIPEEPIPAGPAFLGPESLRAVNHAIEQADRLGLHLGMIASSSWNAGGSWIQPRDAMKGLYESEITVNGPALLSQVLPFPACNAPRGTDGLPLYHKEIAVLAFPPSPSNTISNAATVIDLSEKMNSEGLLTWDVPPGSWVIARFITSNTGQKLMVPSPNSNGLLIDHLDGNAAQTHFRYIIDQILKVRPSLDALRYMEVDSVEVDNQTDWTDSFVAEFRKRRGYDPIPYLPVLKGKSFADPQITSRFQHDYRKTVSDLWIDGHYRASREFLNTYGMQLVAEGGHGGYPRAEPLRACGVVDIARGEFWNGAQFWVVKEAASAAHIYNRQLVDAESFTGWRHWQDGPLEYKRLADTAFCDGLNRITFHTFAHTPPQAGVPGSMYHAGEHFNVNSTWWPKAAPMLSYFSRCCYLLQQGLPVADVCFYYGDDAPNLVATRRIGPDSKRLDGATCAHCGRPNPAPADALGTGYDYDAINSDVIENRMEFKDGRLVLPHGVSYSVIVLPERTDIPLPVLKKLEKLVRDGATVYSAPSPRVTHRWRITPAATNRSKPSPKRCGVLTPTARHPGVPTAKAR